MKEDERILMAYIAGAMDGDGSFSLCKKIEKEDRSPLYYPFIQFGCLQEELVDLFVKVLGGRKMSIKSKTDAKGIVRRDFFSWRAEKVNQCLPVLEKLCSFLVIKKERAEFLIKYIINHPFKRGSNKLSQMELDDREYCYRRMREFNDSRSYKNGFSKKNANISTEDPVFWSYLAGLMDTDGSFSIRKNKPSCGSKNYRFSPLISLSMNDILGLNLIKENIPYGNFKTYRANSCVMGISNRWSVQCKEEVIELLKKIIPFLKIKKENAKILLDFCINFTPVLHKQASIPSEELAIRESYYCKLINLNKYGVYKPSLIDLEVPKQDDRAEGESHGDRLSEKASKEDATVRSRL